ncbi:hypothetical protein RIF29_16220 [Crotalaria pallida]|uniref:Secreted protein n=1 Tax=Crotalaria pallida TaxID=3830 RepID=A0AAN9FM10_CROPI
MLVVWFAFSMAKIHGESSIIASCYALTMRSIVSSITPNPTASLEPIMVLIRDVAPTINCGLFFLAKVVNRRNSPFLDDMW